MAWGAEPLKRSSTLSLPARIKVSNPDLADSLRETASPSMHPKLRTVPEPYSVSHWNSRFDLPDTEDINEMPNLPKLTPEEHKFKKALADTFEAEMIDTDETEVPGIPSTGYRRGEAASLSDAARVEADREETSARDSEREHGGDEVARYYERVGEKLPRYVHLSMRREIRLYYIKQTETPAGQEDQQQEHVVSEEEEESAPTEEEEEEPAFSEDEQEDEAPASCEEEHEEPAFSEEDAVWGYEQEQPASWENQQEKPPSWEEERLLYTPDSNSDIKW